MDTQSAYNRNRSLPLRQRSTTLYSSTLSARHGSDEGAWSGSRRRSERADAYDSDRSSAWERGATVEETQHRPRREYVSAYLEESSVVRVTRRSQRGSSYTAWDESSDRVDDRDDYDDRGTTELRGRRTASVSASAGLRERLSNGWRVFTRQDDEADDTNDFAADEDYDIEPYGFDRHDGDFDGVYDVDYEREAWREAARRHSYVEDYSTPSSGNPLLNGLQNMGKKLTGAPGLATNALASVGTTRVLRALLVVAAVAWCLGTLYPPLRNYYLANRQLDALQTSYDAVSKQNEEIRGELAYLQTHEGIEDVARTRGYVEPGDTKVIVEGVQETGYDPSQPYTPKEEKVVEEREWYIEMLDKLFGYEPEA